MEFVQTIVELGITGKHQIRHVINAIPLVEHVRVRILGSAHHVDQLLSSVI
jgi:hypothetical protein